MIHRIKFRTLEESLFSMLDDVPQEASLSRHAEMDQQSQGDEKKRRQCARASVISDHSCRASGHAIALSVKAVDRVASGFLYV